MNALGMLAGLVVLSAPPAPVGKGMPAPTPVLLIGGTSNGLHSSWICSCSLEDQEPSLVVTVRERLENHDIVLEVLVNFPARITERTRIYWLEYNDIRGCISDV